MNKIMEYMALGKPIVQFDMTEGRVSAGESSLYAAPNDPQDFAEKLVKLLDDPESRARMGALGRSRVEEDLSWSRQVLQRVSRRHSYLSPPTSRRSRYAAGICVGVLGGSVLGIFSGRSNRVQARFRCHPRVQSAGYDFSRRIAVQAVRQEIHIRSPRHQSRAVPGKSEAIAAKACRSVSIPLRLPSLPRNRMAERFSEAVWDLSGTSTAL